jgi:hypothetical protein
MSAEYSLGLASPIVDGERLKRATLWTARSMSTKHSLNLIVVIRRASFEHTNFLRMARGVFGQYRLHLTVPIISTGFDRTHCCRRLRWDFRGRRTRADSRFGDAEVTMLLRRRTDGFRCAKVPVHCASGRSRHRPFRTRSVRWSSGTWGSAAFIGSHQSFMGGFCTCTVLLGLVECIANGTDSNGADDATKHTLGGDATGKS